MTTSYAAPRTERFGIATTMSALAAGAVLSGIALESTRAVRTRTTVSTEPELIVQPSAGEQSVYVLPGCRSDGRFIAEHLGSQLTELGSVYTTVYPDRGFPLDKIRDNLLEARRYDDRPAAIYAMSMGAIVMSHLLEDGEFRSKFGAIDTMVFDSSPSRVADLHPHVQKATRAARFVPGVPVAAQIYSHYMMRRVESRHREQDIPDMLLAEHERSTAGTPYYAVNAQLRLLRDTDFAPAALHDARVGRIAYLSSEVDDVVQDLDGARQNFVEIYDREIERVIDSERANPSHAVGVEHPTEVLKQLAVTDDALRNPTMLRAA